MSVVTVIWWGCCALSEGGLLFRTRLPATALDRLDRAHPMQLPYLDIHLPWTHARMGNKAETRMVAMFWSRKARSSALAARETRHVGCITGPWARPKKFVVNGEGWMGRSYSDRCMLQVHGAPKQNRLGGTGGQRDPVDRLESGKKPSTHLFPKTPPNAPWMFPANHLPRSHSRQSC